MQRSDPVDLKKCKRASSDAMQELTVWPGVADWPPAQPGVSGAPGDCRPPDLPEWMSPAARQEEMDEHAGQLILMNNLFSACVQQSLWSQV